MVGEYSDKIIHKFKAARSFSTINTISCTRYTVQFCILCKMQDFFAIIRLPEGMVQLIKSIKHKGLKKFFSSAGTDTRGINSDHKGKLGDQLAALDSAADIADMDLPGWRLHPLKGREKGRHAIWVSGNWRMTFEFEDGDAYVVDYEDYH